MRANPLEVPTAAVELDEDNEVSLLSVSRKRVDVEAIALRALPRFQQRREIEVSLVVRRSSR